MNERGRPPKPEQESSDLGRAVDVIKKLVAKSGNKLSVEEKKEVEDLFSKLGESLDLEKLHGVKLEKKESKAEISRKEILEKVKAELAEITVRAENGAIILGEIDGVVGDEVIVAIYGSGIETRTFKMDDVFTWNPELDLEASQTSTEGEYLYDSLTLFRKMERHPDYVQKMVTKHILNGKLSEFVAPYLGLHVSDFDATFESLDTFAKQLNFTYVHEGKETSVSASYEELFSSFEVQDLVTLMKSQNLSALVTAVEDDVRRTILSRFTPLEFFNLLKMTAESAPQQYVRNAAESQINGKIIAKDFSIDPEGRVWIEDDEGKGEWVGLSWRRTKDISLDLNTFNDTVVKFEAQAKEITRQELQDHPEYSEALSEEEAKKIIEEIDFDEKDRKRFLKSVWDHPLNDSDVSGTKIEISPKSNGAYVVEMGFRSANGSRGLMRRDPKSILSRLSYPEMKYFLDKYHYR